MELEHTFTVPVPEERAWDVLLDVERVAPCMPGASLDSVQGDEIKGRIKVKVGPISMTYAGTARFTERDPQAHVITLEATGKETRGAGTASATVRSMLEARGDQTHVIVHTTLNVTGRPAQFGRGVMAEVGGKLIGIFAGNLADMLTADNAAGSPAAAAGAAQADPAGVAEAAAAQADAARAAAAQADAAGAAAGAAADLALPVEELHLALRSHNSLRRDGIHTVGELAARTEQQLLAIDHIGPASVEEIRQKLAERGLSLSTAGGSAASAGSAGSASADRADVSSAASQGGTPASAAGAAAGNGAVPSRAAANGDSRPAGSSPRQDRADSRPPGEEAIDLLSVAGLPVLKRVIPVLAGLAVVIAVVFGFRLRRRRADR
jgi:carbon monoxide dehydrogenase subunit G